MVEKDYEVSGYIYLIQCKQDIGTNIFKIGRTLHNISKCDKLKRLSSYGKNSILCFCLQVDPLYVIDIEASIIENFTKSFRISRGNEYFEGNTLSMLNICVSTINEFASRYQEHYATTRTNHAMNKFIMNHCDRKENVVEEKTTFDSFVKDFIEVCKCSKPTDFCINIDTVCKWLNVRKEKLMITLRRSYQEGFDFTVSKGINPNKKDPRNNNYKIVLLTPDCFKLLCMQSASKNSQQIRRYFLETETMLLK